MALIQGADRRVSVCEGERDDDTVEARGMWSRQVWQAVVSNKPFRDVTAIPCWVYWEGQAKQGIFFDKWG